MHDNSTQGQVPLMRAQSNHIRKQIASWFVYKLDMVYTRLLDCVVHQNSILYVLWMKFNHYPLVLLQVCLTCHGANGLLKSFLHSNVNPAEFGFKQ